ncbi:unnamed protein product [Protopolystoma xenopodis]|uniref:Uncharacterized protein n=1 Tax=Protopolystoma xenopodis TaxID=117903 RepID=A0A3S5A553_9PLAT|nr:unnamed protein product [Protopolystoma xenopodis]
MISQLEGFKSIIWSWNLHLLRILCQPFMLCVRKHIDKDSPVPVSTCLHLQNLLEMSQGLSRLALRHCPATDQAQCQTTVAEVKSYFAWTGPHVNKCLLWLWTVCMRFLLQCGD